MSARWLPLKALLVAAALIAPQGCATPNVHCEVHCDTRLEKQTVGIHYGLPASHFMNAYYQEFPHPGFVFGGCVIKWASTRWGEYVCPRCVEALSAWREANR